MNAVELRHLFDLETWVKIETRAAREGKTPEAVAVFILSERVGLIPQSGK